MHVTLDIIEGTWIEGWQITTDDGRTFRRFGDHWEDMHGQQLDPRAYRPLLHRLNQAFARWVNPQGRARQENYHAAQPL